MRWIFILILIVSTIRLSECQEQRQVPDLPVYYIFYESESVKIWHRHNQDTSRQWKIHYQKIKLKELWKN